MKSRNLGRSDLVVSRLALGTMTFGAETDQSTAEAVLDRYVGAGGTLIDTADSYQDGTSEHWIGDWFANRPGRRDQLVLATKGRFPVAGQPGAGLSPTYLATALDASLRRLRTDHIDLYQLHGPDRRHPFEGTLGFLADAVKAGKIRYVGVSNVTGWQLAKLAQLAPSADVPLISHQPQYNLLARRC